MTDAPVTETIAADQVDAPNLHEVNLSAVSAAQSKDAQPAAAPGQPQPPPLSKPAPSAALPAGAVWSDGKPRVDRNGRTFDPTIHATNPDGSVATRRDGKLTIRKDARGESLRASVLPPLEPGQTAGAESPPAGDIPPGENVPPPPPPVDYGQVAREIVDPLLGAVTVILGAEEWSFEQAERDQYVRVTEQLAMKYNIAAGFPPELQLAQLMVASVAARADKPKTAKLLARAREWIARKILRRRVIDAPREDQLETTAAASAASEGGRPLREAERVDTPTGPVAKPTNPPAPPDQVS